MDQWMIERKLLRIFAVNFIPAWPFFFNPAGKPRKRQKDKNS